MQIIWNRFFTAFYTRIVSSEAILHRYKEILSSLFDDSINGRTILDVGCGPGYATYFLASRFQQSIVLGIDFSAPMLRRARQQKPPLSNLAFQQANALHLPFRDQTIDVILSIGSIKHWPDQQHGIRELYRVLRPGGEILIAEADRNCRAENVQRFVRQWTNIPSWLHTFCAWGFQTFVAGYGIDVERVRELLQTAEFQELDISQYDTYPAVVARGKKLAVD